MNVTSEDEKQKQVQEVQGKRKSSFLHSHVAVRAAVSKCAPLLLEGDEVPYGHHGVVRHIEVEQFHTGEGVESIQFTRRAGEVFSHKKAICREQNQRRESVSIFMDEDMIYILIWKLYRRTYICFQLNMSMS